MYTPVNSSFTLYVKAGFKGAFMTRTCFPDVFIRKISFKSSLFSNTFNLLFLCQCDVNTCWEGKE